MKRILLLLCCYCIVAVSCKKNDDTGGTEYSLDGYAQKGPFQIGANVTIVELDETLDPTGKTYLSTIVDNTGKFSFPSVSLASNYVQVKVTGQAYNEIADGVSTEELTLYAIADLASSSQINVNVITTMVEGRLKVLVDAGSSYADAKKQAEQELLKIFNLESYTTSDSETLDLTSGDVDGGVLLLISSIIQRKVFSTLTFMEYITSLKEDFKSDGEINTASLQTILATSADVLNIEQINTNLKNYYASHDVAYTPYNAKPLLKQFLANTGYSSCLDIIFPGTSNGAINLISADDTIIIDKSQQYVIAINCPANNDLTNIQVALTSSVDSYTTSNVTWYTSDTTRRYLKDMTDNTNLEIPVTFTGSGQLTLNLYIFGSDIMVTDYPSKTVIWTE